MKMTIDDIPPEGLSLKFKEEGDKFHLDEEELSFRSPVKVAVKLTRSKEKVLVSGKIEGQLELACSRCLEPCSYQLSAPLELVYSPSQVNGSQVKGDVELGEEDFKIAHYQEGIIDLTDDVRQAIILTLPVKPLCQPRCRGLCPHCGQNLNEARCKCQDKMLDPRLAKLGKLFKDR